MFLGIKNVVDDDLEFLRAKSKNTRREHGRGAGNAAIKAIEYIHQNKMYVNGGLIVGNPSDTRESIQTNLHFTQRYTDWPYVQHPTPYPRTPMTKGLRARGLVTSDRILLAKMPKDELALRCLPTAIQQDRPDKGRALLTTGY